MTWILILFLHVGPMGEGNSVTVTNVPDFKTEASCEEAGKKALTLTRTTVKQSAYVCVKQ